MKRRFRLIAVVAATIAIVACTNPFKAGEMSDTSVAAFHQKLNQAKYHEIYAASTPEFQKASPEADIIQLFNAIHTKLGDTVSTNRTGIFVNATTSGNFARVTYDTTFTHGKGQETFNWLLSGDQLTLVGYNIESRDLMVK